MVEDAGEGEVVLTGQQVEPAVADDDIEEGELLPPEEPEHPTDATLDEPDLTEDIEDLKGIDEIDPDAEIGFEPEDLPEPDPEAELRRFPSALATERRAAQTTPQKQELPTFRAPPTSSDDYLPEAELPDIEKVYANLIARDAEEVLDNKELLGEVYKLMDASVLTDYRTRVVVALRYGIYTPNTTQAQKQAQAINRSGKYIKMTDVMEKVPSYQGLDLGSTSLLTGLTTKAVLKTELDFLQAFAEKTKVQKPAYPAIKKFLPKMRIQAIMLESAQRKALVS